VLRSGIDLRLRVEREEGEAGCGGVVDVVELLQMIRVTADGLRPAGLESTPRRIVEDIPRSPAAAPHLPDGLLGENGSDRCADRLQRAYMARRRQPQPVAEAG
jgi:hypothetical protein